MDELTTALTRDPGGVTRGGGGVAVERHCQLQRHQGKSSTGVLAKGLVEQARRARLFARGELDRDPAVAEDAGTATGRLLARIIRGDHHPLDPCLEDRLDAGWLPALVRAGLKRHVHRRPARIIAPRCAIGQRRPLGVQVAQLGVKALADRPAVAHDDRTNERIRADPAASALGKLQRPAHVSLIRACELGIHATD